MSTIYKKYKIISYIYLFFLTVSLLIPLDNFIITTIVDENKQPNNSIAFFMHFILFFLLCYLCNYIFIKKAHLLLFCIIYSIAIEYLQIITGRGFQYFDIIFNIVGVLTSYLYLRLNEK